MAITGASRDFLAWLGWFNLLFWPVALLLIAWGALLVSRCIVPTRSRLARLAEKVLPDPAGLDDAAIALLVVVAPAALLTLLLRLIGVSGQRN